MTLRCSARSPSAPSGPMQFSIRASGRNGGAHPALVPSLIPYLAMPALVAALTAAIGQRRPAAAGAPDLRRTILCSSVRRCKWPSCFKG